MRALWRAVGRLARHRRATILVTMVLAFIGSAAPTTVRRAALVPEVHDEFGYLLLGDTFAHGRLTNPPHPQWQSFETLHVLQQPTYQAKYPPAQGWFLALGQALAGLPILGVWISAALLCGALCWMLQGWVPARWALLGTLLIGVPLILGGRPYPGGQLGYWSQSYWGGAVAALGGALVYGGLRRIVHRPRTLPSLLCAVGFVLLANSRPYEGLVISLPAIALLAGRLLFSRRREQSGFGWRRAVLSMMLVLGLGGAFTAYYDWRVTGHATVMPHALYTSQYGVHPIFLWQKPSAVPVYRNTAMRDYHVGWELKEGYRPGRSILTLGVESFWRWVRAMRFQLGPIVALATLLMLPWVVRSWWGRFALAVCVTELAGSSLSAFYYEHYVAPMSAMSALLGVQALRRWGALRLRRWPTGRALVLLLLAGTLAFVARQWVKELRGAPRAAYAWAVERAAITRRLSADGERHLIIVRYGPQHTVHADRIANGADIDGSAVVWAREMDPEQNARLLDYFRDRRAWLMYVDADNEPSTLSPYPRR